MSEFLAKKVVSTLPVPLDADTVYFVRAGNGFDIYVTNALGLVTAYELNTGGPPSSLNLSTDYTDSEPSAPSTGIKLFAKKTADRRRLAYKGPIGRAVEVQSFLGSNKISWWSAQGSSTTVHAMGFGTTTTGSTQRNASNTNLFTMSRRLGLVATSVNAGYRHSLLQFNREAGFDLIATLGISAQPSSGWFRIMFGLPSVTTGIAALGSGSCVGAGIVLTNGVSNTPNGISVISCEVISATQTVHTTLSTSDFPTNTANVDMYELRLFCPPGGNIGWSVTRLTGGTGQQAQGTITTQLPGLTTLLSPCIQLQQQNSGANAAFDLVSLYMETDL